ncbi:MAG: ABC transporter permease [Anaerolineales bacterium]|nr:MAG: ABC transporter permease [Chloroflexota bacterium]MBE7434167.1 ABC transporter permease [Anaerolineales bacterium]MCE7861863.1 ABC transporter permease [Chloroflexi bacterium CFX2]GJQ34575.1 MAG: peptide ABC transporter permease [Anaerolineaceae bacterium]
MTTAPSLVENLPNEPVANIKALSLTDLAVRRFRKHKMAMFGLWILAFLLLYVTVPTFLLKGYCAPIQQEVRGEAWANCNDTSLKLSPPSSDHWFGTDAIGRDIFARTIYGGQISMMIGIFAVLFQLFIGSMIGAISAYYGGWIDNMLMRFTEAMLNIPSLFLLIIGARFFGGNIQDIQLFGREFSGSVIVIIVIIGATSWMYLARIVRANILSLREQDFVSASKAMGASDTRIIFRHLIPNTVAPLIVSGTLGVAGAIISEAYVSFLGLGVQGATATWGNMLDGAYRYLETAPWLWFFPGMLILLIVLGINFVGDGLRDALDPRSSRHL